MVDLDGAREGEPRNLEALRRIVAAVDCPVQAGGGLRDRDAVAAALAAGAQRVVIGTAALRDPAFLAAMLEEHGDRVVVAVDSRAGTVALAGWTQSSETDPRAAVADLAGRGVARFLFTPIEVDGTMAGPGITEMRQVADASEARILYSGGVGDLDDLRSLAAAAPENVEGVVVGKALYEGAFTVAEGDRALNPA